MKLSERFKKKLSKYMALTEEQRNKISPGISIIIPEQLREKLEKIRLHYRSPSFRHTIRLLIEDTAKDLATYGGSITNNSKKGN
jgi:hypothetical protein